ncbi:hypothetical protein EWM64_g6123 [Hericium alpestre]|uniref:Uncharacterized protein n=1 Tax=Hericium alpestre TaxID=135208 RepID=A0A4Y9ZV10_9AGAM|nr:hypothetical protein EWM64_g6123 [Hericium alpestre]
MKARWIGQRSRDLVTGGDRRWRESRAIERGKESKRSLAAEKARAGEDRDLAEAIRLSKEEEDRRSRAVLDSNSSGIFDEQNQQNNNNLLIDMGQQPVQPQFTAVQPQFTNFNPYQQQAQQEAMQQEYLRQQQEWMRQQQEAQAQAQAQAQLQAQQEEWLRQQQMQQQYQQQQQQQQYQQQQQQMQVQPLVPQPTSFGSNNPFAPAVHSFSPGASTSPPPNNHTPVSFNLPSTYETHSPSTNLSSISTVSSTNPSPSPSAPSSSLRGPSRADQEHANLAGLFAAPREDGLDTFGNIGQLRYGHTDAGRIATQKTGASGQQPSFNPFAQQQQQQQQHQNNEQPFFSI